MAVCCSVLIIVEYSPSPDLVSGISYLRLCVYHRQLDSFKASWRQYFFARPTRHDSARSWLLRLLELRLTNFPTYLLQTSWSIVSNANGWFCWTTERTKERVRWSDPCCTGTTGAKEEEEVYYTVNEPDTSASWMCSNPWWSSVFIQISSFHSAYEQLLLLFWMLFLCRLKKPTVHPEIEYFICFFIVRINFGVEDMQNILMGLFHDDVCQC